MADYSTKDLSSVLQDLGLEEPPRNFPTLNDFYKFSIIKDLDSFYENCMLMAIKSSNNQQTIKKLPFFEYVKLQKALQKYIESENKQNGANNGNENDEMKNHMNNMSQNTSGMMNQMKSNFKLPKIK